MAYVDFTTGTETDPGGYITVNSTKVEWNVIPEESAAYVYKDYGASYFNTGADITHYFTQYITSDNNQSGVNHMSYGLSNTAPMASNAAVQKMLCRTYVEAANDVRLTAAYYYNGSNENQDAAFLGSNLNTPLYVTAFYDYSVGSYGSWNILVYSDSGRTNLIDSASMTMTGGRLPSFRYLYAYGYYGASVGSYVQDGYIENVDIGGGASSSIKTVNGLAYASVKTVNGLAVASVKTINGLA